MTNGAAVSLNDDSIDTIEPDGISFIEAVPPQPAGVTAFFIGAIVLIWE